MNKSNTRQVTSKPNGFPPLKNKSKRVAGNKAMGEWKHINWRKLERCVFKLQKRIYKASQRDDLKAIRRLQKTLMKSWYARCISVRRVTQDNTGKKTAGVDGVKALSPEARFKLVNNINLGSKAKPTRRVWIPKPGTEEKRHLWASRQWTTERCARVSQNGSRARIALRDLRRRFGGGSFPRQHSALIHTGSDSCRSRQDAIESIFCVIKQKDKFVLDADIAKCFDRIDHEALLEKLNTFPWRGTSV